MNEKIYLHEIIDIILQGRPKYFHHMTAGWGPTGRAERGMQCVGVWGTLGSTARWPEVINLWEFDGWDAIAKKGADAARANDIAGVKAACKSCHDDLRPRFKKELRDKPLF